MKPESKIIVYVYGDVASHRVGEFVADAVEHIRSGEMGTVCGWRHPDNGDKAFLSRNGKSFRLNVQVGKVAP